MTTFEVKLMVLNALGQNYTQELAKQAYDWLMDEVEIEPTAKEASVTKLTPVN